VQEIGDWSNIQIVLNTYSHVIPSLKSEAAAKMEEIFGSSDAQVATKRETARIV
jgi:hypothetical protein